MIAMGLFLISALFTILSSAHSYSLSVLNTHLQNGSVLDGYRYFQAEFNSSPTIADNKMIMSTVVTLEGQSFLSIYAKNITKDTAFVIFQAHTLNDPIALYQEGEVPNNISTFGTNIAIYSNNFTEPFTILNHLPDKKVNVYITVHAYGPHDPIPGGCSMEKVMPIVPYMDLEYFDNYVQVSAPGARRPSDPNCLNSNVDLKFYVYYLDPRTLDEVIYFASLQKMQSIDSVFKIATEVPYTYWNVRRKVSRYDGNSRVYVAIASTNNGFYYSMYAPIFENGCIATDCNNENVLDLYIQVVMFSGGIVLCFFGNAVVYITLFIIAFTMGFIGLYMATIYIGYGRQFVLYGLSAVYALCLCVYYYWKWYNYHVPKFSHILCTSCLGCLLGASLHFYLLDYVMIMRSNLNFWSMFAVLVLLTNAGTFGLPSILTFVTPLLGSYMLSFTVSDLLSGNLQYVVINLIRRATSSEFCQVLMMPSERKVDDVITTIAGILAVSGLFFQFGNERRRKMRRSEPPPRPASQSTYEVNETTPLVTSQGIRT